MSKGMLGKLRLSDIRGPVAALYDNLASAGGQRVLDELKKFNKQQPCWLQEGKSTKLARSSQLKFLEKDGYFSAVTLRERHDPNEFYKDRTGLYILPDFRNKIVSVAKPTEAGKKFKKISRFKLTQDGTTGEQLRQACPNSVWDASKFCAWLSIKLASQPNAEEGELLNTGWANLFLVERLSGGVFVVRVYWGSGSREWDVSAWQLDRTWGAGGRFASR